MEPDDSVECDIDLAHPGGIATVVGMELRPRDGGGRQRASSGVAAWLNPSTANGSVVTQSPVGQR